MKKSRILLILSVFAIIVLAILFLYLVFASNSLGLRSGYNSQYNNKVLVEEFKHDSNLNQEQILKTEPEIANQENEIDNSLKFLFFGDVMLDRHVAEIIERDGLTQVLKELEDKQVDLFEGQDIVSANLEGAVTKNGNHYAPHNLYDFAFKPEIVTKLKDYSFNYFTISNNHILDQGELGLKETRDNLKNLDFYFSGASDAEVDDNSLTYLEVKDKKVAMLAFSMVYHHFDRQLALDLIEKARSEADLVIVNIHWGTEYEHVFNYYQQEVAHDLIDAGVDIIIGHHPHVIQGMEIYKNKPIFYSLGNFIFDQYFSKSTQEGLAVEVEFKEEEIKINLHPFVSIKSAPFFMNKTEAQALITEFKTWSQKDSQDLVAQEVTISLN